METKVCSKCRKELPATREYFYKKEDGKLGLNSKCKVCKIEQQKQYYEKNKERYKEYKKQYYEENKECFEQYYEENKEQILEQQKKYYKDNKEQNKEQKKECDKKYREKNKQQIKEYMKQWREENKEKIKQRTKRWYERNKEQIIKQKVQYAKERKKADVGFRILANYRIRLYNAIKGRNKSASTQELIGCTVEQLLEHLESQFQEGMNWDNYGKWHVDHIKPCAMFDFTREEQQRECFHYTNLQPLWAEDNLLKSDNYIKQYA